MEYLQHADTLWHALVLNLIEDETTHIEEAHGRVGGKGFLHVVVNYAISIVYLSNAQMVFVLVQVMIDGILFTFNWKTKELKLRIPLSL